MGEITLDDRGRVLIPRKIRETLALKPHQKLKEYIHGSNLKPLQLKEIWE